jgi:hypothetical protein
VVQATPRLGDVVFTGKLGNHSPKIFEGDPSKPEAKKPDHSLHSYLLIFLIFLKLDFKLQEVISFVNYSSF